MNDTKSQLPFVEFRFSRSLGGCVDKGLGHCHSAFAGSVIPNSVITVFIIEIKIVYCFQGHLPHSTESEHKTYIDTCVLH